MSTRKNTSNTVFPSSRSMTRRTFMSLMALAGTSTLAACSRFEDSSAVEPTFAPTADEANGSAGSSDPSTALSSQDPSSGPREVDGFTFVEGSMEDRGFVVDDVLETQGRTLHFSLHIPDAYDGASPFALYVACPGWEGLYFQGVGAHLQEDFPFVANGYIADMIVASPQLDDWGETSAQDTILLTEWLLSAFNIDPGRVYLSGCSGGGETISLVLGLRPDLYARALHLISRWDGDIEALAENGTPVYLAIGENDDYYGSEPAREAAESIRGAYRARGLSETQIDELVVLDVKPSDYFTERGFPENGSQHEAGGRLFAHDEGIMGWLFP